MGENRHVRCRTRAGQQQRKNREKENKRRKERVRGEGKASSFVAIDLNESAGRDPIFVFSCEFASAVNKGENELGESKVGKKREIRKSSQLDKEKSYRLHSCSSRHDLTLRERNSRVSSRIVKSGEVEFESFTKPQKMTGQNSQE